MRTTPFPAPPWKLLTDMPVAVAPPARLQAVLTKRIDYVGCCGCLALATSCKFAKCCNKCGLVCGVSCCGKKERVKPPKRKCCGLCLATDKCCGGCGEHGECSLCGLCGQTGCCWLNTPPLDEIDEIENTDFRRCCSCPCGA